MPDKKDQSSYVLTYIFFLCLITALILSTTSEYLKPLQKIEKESAQYKQLLISCKILDSEGYFQNSAKKKKASKIEIRKVYKSRVIPMVTNQSGKAFTFKEAGIDYNQYIEKHHKQGYSALPFKLFYLIKGEKPDTIDAYVLPINGYGLWDAMYGYLSIRPNKTEILGVTFYDQRETPGLGAEVSQPTWQKNFDGKTLLFRGKENTLSIENSIFRLQVRKPAQISMMNQYEKNNAVPAISGATITSNGVEELFKRSLKEYRNFLLDKS